MIVRALASLQDRLFSSAVTVPKSVTGDRRTAARGGAIDFAAYRDPPSSELDIDTYVAPDGATHSPTTSSSKRGPSVKPIDGFLVCEILIALQNEERTAMISGTPNFARLRRGISEIWLQPSRHRWPVGQHT
jgi:hypothetical protein